MSGASVWVIDDDRSIRWVLERALTQAGMAVAVFENGAEAMAQLGVEQPDAVISDIRMPEMDGLSLLENISARYPRLPVIIMTAYSDLESTVSAYQSGAFEYLPKPFDVDEAVALVRRALGRQARRRQDRQAPAEDRCRERRRRYRRLGTCHAGGVPRHRSAVPIQYHRAHHR